MAASEINAAAPTAEFAPGFVAIGGDGASTAYGYIWRGGVAEYMRVEMEDLSLEALEPMGASLRELIEKLMDEGRSIA